MMAHAGAHAGALAGTHAGALVGTHAGALAGAHAGALAGAPPKLAHSPPPTGHWQAPAQMPKPPTVGALLLHSARINLAIRREYARAKRDPLARYYTYVLQLQDGKFYVGNTDNIYARLVDHFLMGPSSAKWVQAHGPVRRVVEVCTNSAKTDEMYKTMLYMTLFGWQNVRGSSYCKVDMAREPDPLKSFARAGEGDFEYLGRDELDAVVAVVEELAGEARRLDAELKTAAAPAAHGSPCAGRDRHDLGR